MADASAVDTLIQALAVSTLGQEMRTPLGQILYDIITATDLDGDEQFDAVRAHVDERLHPRGYRRDVMPLQPGAPVIQFNAPFQSVSGKTYAANRMLMRVLAEAAEARGYSVEVTSDYAYPGQPQRADDHMVRSGILRSAANVVLISGGRTGTGRTLEASAIFMIPALLLRREDDEDASNPDRFSGDVSGQHPQDFSDTDSALRLLNEFLDAHVDHIDARHRNLVRWDNESVGREGELVMAADPSLFERSQLTRGQAVFWADPVHWPQAPDSVHKEMRRVVGLTEPVERSTATPLAVGRRASHRALIAYAIMASLSTSRLGDLWDAHIRQVDTGRVAGRTDPVMAVEDWAQLDGRL